jgi:biotin carboxyl carrier protein
MKQFIYRINGQEYIVAVNKMDNDFAEVAVNGANYKVELVNNEEVTLVARPAAKAPATTAPKTVSPAPAKPAGGGGAGSVKSPLPGIIIDVLVNEGDEVKRGQTVVMLEAMKMENAIQATQNGKVTGIHVAKGDSVLEGVALITIE